MPTPNKKQHAPATVRPITPAAFAWLMVLSGACVLIYQISWLREFRLIFGGSTVASGAVLAIFMAGLGIGNAWFGRCADLVTKPLALYGRLEIGIALSALVSLWLIDVAQSVYIGMGGRVTLGIFLATLVRLLLASLVLALPTILMGGSLPAAVRTITTSDDQDRKSLSLLYGANALGAVLGTILSTFLLLETLGTRKTLWCACAITFALGAIALAISRSRETDTSMPTIEIPTSQASTHKQKRRKNSPDLLTKELTAPANFVYAAAGTVGFAFFLMELVWFRMITPLLGGTTFTFEIILALALAGIGLGGFLYGTIARWLRPTLRSFAITCGLEALCLAIPYAAGDRIALYARDMNMLEAISFLGLIGNWILVSSLIVFPTAIISGIQFPLLIALPGKGRDSISKQSGNAFAWNTVGAIAGSLAGGFGLLPLLSAPGTWIAVIVIICTLGLAALLLQSRLAGHSLMRSKLPIAMLAISLGALFCDGPTADFDWERVVDYRQVFLTLVRGNNYLPPHATPNQKQRAKVLEYYQQADTKQMIEAWRAAKYPLVFPDEYAIIALALADQRDAEVQELLKPLQKFNAATAYAISSFYHAQLGEPHQAAQTLESAFLAMRTDPWIFSHAAELLFPTAN